MSGGTATGTGAATGTGKRSRKTTGMSGGGGGGGGGSGGGGGGGGDPTKNTRRRVQQKRTRNTTRPKTTEDKVKQPPIVLPKPVLESTNPFFIAVCAPDSYRPSSSSSMANHRSNNGNGGNGNRRSDVSVSQRQKPNVFLRQNNRNSTQGRSTITTANSGGSGAMNHFIHHPIIQNDRQRIDNTVGVVSSNGYTNTTAHTNIHDKEQFPSLSSASTSTTISSEPVTKLNFKEMVLRSGSVGDSKGDCGGGGGGSTVKVTPVPKVRAEYSQKALSSGNIFLGAFCGSSNNESMDEEDDYDETSGQRAVISSVLIDSCDRKYDNLYR